MGTQLVYTFSVSLLARRGSSNTSAATVQGNQVFFSGVTILGAEYFTDLFFFVFVECK
jgi:hypothetical protein